jgi:drug/metabolite transporter (DMT)-like permease
MKIAVAYATPLEFLTLRGAIAIVCLFGALIVMRKPLRPQLPGYTFAIGVTQVGGFGLLTMLALEISGVGRTSILAYTFPFWVALLAWAVLKERAHGLQLLALPIALVGFAFILWPFTLGSSLLGAASAVGAGIVWAIAAVLMKLAARRHTFDTLTMTAWQMLLGTLVLAVAAVLAPHPPIVWAPAFVFSLFFGGVVSNALGWFLWMYALSGLSAGVASFGILLCPVVGAVAAALQLGERDPVPQLVGFGVLFLALLVFSLEGVREGTHTVQLAKTHR